MASRTHPGIRERRDASGRVRFQVRVRRGDRVQVGTLGTLRAALSWQAQAYEAADGIAEQPARPQQQRAPEPPGRAATVEDASRRLCRGMVDGSIRSRDGRRYKPGVTRKYEAALRLLVLPRIGSVPLTVLTGGDCQRLVDELAAERTAEHGRQALTGLRVALRVAQRYGELDSNPCAGVRVPVDARGEKPARVLTPEEAVAIVDAAELEDARLGRSFAAPLLALAFGTGLRLGELLALRWGPLGLDLDAAIVRVRASLDRVRDESGAYAELEPKSRASRRDVPLPPEDTARLLRHRLATGRPPNGALVFSKQGAALGPVAASRAFKRACVAAGFVAPLPRLHDTRHGFATHALAAGLSAHAVAALLGHSDAGLVLRRYGHALPDEVAGAGVALGAWRQARAAALGQEWATASAEGADLQG